MRERLFPKPAPPGATLGLIAPASPVYELERRDAAVRLLEDMGYQVKRGRSVDLMDRCYEESEVLRAQDVMDMFLDDSVDALVCLRGGYGAARLLGRLDYGRMMQHPKLLVGFSDITALHAALWKECGLITIHGPMPGNVKPYGLREPRARAQWLQALSGDPVKAIANPGGEPFEAYGEQAVAGRLIGGNMRVLCSLMGTPWEPEWDGALLLLEDVAERPDQLEVMAAQLEKQGVFRRIAGLVLGDFCDYEGHRHEHMSPIAEVFPRHLPRRLPVLWNVHAGHGWDRMTLVMNLVYRLDPLNATLTLLE